MVKDIRGFICKHCSLPPVGGALEPILQGKEAREAAANQIAGQRDTGFRPAERQQSERRRGEAAASTSSSGL